MSGRIIHKRSLTPGSIPTTSSLEIGELAVNVDDGKIFLRRSGSGNDDIIPVVTANTTTIGTITATSFTGSLQGTSSWAENALTASHVNQLNQNVTIVGNLNVFGTASYTYVTASELDVGTNFISVNIAEPAERFGGLKVYDSGSISHLATASLAWDSQRNHWVYQNASGSTYTGGMLMSGPRNTGSLGDEPSLTRWFIARSDGGDHLDNTQIYSSGSDHRITGSVLISDTLTVTNSITTNDVTASLFGTASWAENAISSSNALTASYVNPLQQDVLLTGSLLITGSQIIFSGSQFEMTNNIIINSTTRRLNSGSTLSVDWGVRGLYSTGNSLSVDWQNRQLRSIFGISVNYGSYSLLDVVSSSSIDWSNRTLSTANSINALNWSNDYVNYSNTYLYRFYNQDTQVNFASSVQYSGEVINAAVSSSASQYKLVALVNDIWVPINQNTSVSTNMLAIALGVFEDPAKGEVLLNGDITWDGSDGVLIHPGVASTDTGKPVYIRDNANDGYMSLIPPDSGYVRTVGYIYYEKDGVYIFRFNPSNDWYKLS